VPHERVFNTDPILITQPGYVYIYLSNESPTTVEVYFDDFKVTQIKSPVIQTDDYYPFGLAFGSYQRENSTANDYKFNGKEEQTELELGWLDFGRRMYQPDLGRFFTQDRYAESFYPISPYQYAANNPISFVDVNGDSIIYSQNVDAETRVMLDGFFNTLGKASSAFGEVVNHLRTSSNIFTIDIGETTSNVDGQFAVGKNGGGTITFLSGESGQNAGTTIEEMFHAYQNDVKSEEYPNVANSNIEFESKLFKNLVYDEIMNNSPGSGGVYHNLTNEGGMTAVDNAIIFGGTSLTNKNGDLNFSSANLKSVDFNKFYQKSLSGFVSFWRTNNGSRTYTAEPSEDGPKAIIRVQQKTNK